MKSFGRIRTVYVGPGEAGAEGPSKEELIASGAIQPGDPGHPLTPKILANEAVIARALALADEAALAAAAESAWW